MERRKTGPTCTRKFHVVANFNIVLFEHPFRRPKENDKIRYKGYPSMDFRN
jgi:hypothetical protein